MENIQDEVREIRKELRLVMNGVISTSMREKGIVYKLNFGVAYPEIKEIAKKHEPSSALASALWKEDVREFKILAGFLQPVDEFSEDEALRWVYEIPYLEIAECSCKNLFIHLPYLESFTAQLIADKEHAFARTVALLTWTEFFRREGKLSDSLETTFLCESFSSLSDTASSLKEKQAAVQSMKFYGRISETNGNEVLGRFEKMRENMDGTPELEEIYNELKFEFEYYR